MITQFWYKNIPSELIILVRTSFAMASQILQTIFYVNTKLDLSISNLSFEYIISLK